MDGYRHCLRLLLVVGLVSLSGASCPQCLRQFTAPPPRVLPQAPTLQQVIQVVNDNSSRIHSFSTTRATLSGPSLPALRANLAFQRPKRLRLRAETAITGPELDLGSNDDLFWFWVKRSRPPAVYYCRHDQFATSPARRVMPLELDWLVEALGIIELDPALPHQGPIRLPGGRLEIRTIRETPQGTTTKVTIIDGAQGWVMEQHLYNAQGRLIASAVADGHRRDPLTNLVMPKSVKINCPPAEFSMRVDLGPVQINRLAGNPAELWTMPYFQNATAVDLGNPNLQLPQPPPPPAVSSRPRPQPQGWTRPRY